MAGMGLPLKTDTAISRVPMVSGSGIALEAQSQMFSRLADTAWQIAQPFKKKAEEDAAGQAQQDFATQSEATPEGAGVYLPERRGLFGMEMATDRAYNNMLEALTLDRARRDAGKFMTEQRAKNFGNVAGFNTAMGGWKSGYLEKAPVEVIDELTNLLNGVIEHGANEVITDRVNADIKEARAEMDAGIEALISETETLLRDGVGAMESDQVRARTQMLTDRLDLKANNPLYGYSDGERELDSRAMADRLMVASLVPEVRKVFDSDGYAAALEAADAAALGLSRDEAATSAIRQRLRQEANLMNQNLNARQEAERERQRAEEDERDELGRQLDQAATRMIYNPKASLQQRVDAVNAAAPYITGDRYGALYRLAVKGPSGEDGDGGELFARLMQAARRGELSEDEVFELGAGLSGSSLNRVLEEVAQKSDKDMNVGEALISGAFARSPFSLADFGALGAAEAEAKEDLRRWRLSNPEATANEVAQQAREIAARRGRTAAVAMLSEVNGQSGDFGAPTPESITARMDILATELAKTPSGTSKAQDLKRKYQQLEEVLRLLELGNGP